MPTPVLYIIGRSQQPEVHLLVRAEQLSPRVKAAIQRGEPIGPLVRSEQFLQEAQQTELVAALNELNLLRDVEGVSAQIDADAQTDIILLRFGLSSDVNVIIMAIEVILANVLHTRVDLQYLSWGGA